MFVQCQWSDPGFSYRRLSAGLIFSHVSNARPEVLGRALLFATWCEPSATDYAGLGQGDGSLSLRVG